jgi:hypothetical protein
MYEGNAQRADHGCARYLAAASRELAVKANNYSRNSQLKAGTLVKVRKTEVFLKLNSDVAHDLDSQCCNYNLKQTTPQYSVLASVLDLQASI